MSTLLAPSDLFFKECYNDLDSKKKMLTSIEYKWAFNTIRAIEILQSEKDLFSSIAEERERNNEITFHTKLVAKPGLIPGTNKNELELSIDKKVKKLESTYLFDKLHGETYTFFRDGFLGPSSFNDRMNTLKNYQLRMHKIRTQHLDENFFHIDPSALKLEEFMYITNDILGLSSKTPPPFDTLMAFIKSHAELAKQYGIDQSLKNMIVVYKRACNLFLG
jgi:hypothetical protein